MQRARGFTLIELIVVLAVIGVALGLTAWKISSTLPAWRARGAARWTLAAVRQASAVAARTNQAVEVRVDVTGTANCKPRITVQSLPPAGGTPVVYDTVCLNAEFPGVALANGGVTSDVNCTADTNGGLAAIKNCSLCSGTPDASTLKNIIRVYPSGEAATETTNPAGATIIFTAARNPKPGDTVAVGVRNVSGRARIYQPNDAGTGWVCR